MLADYKLNLLSIMGYNGLRHNTDRTDFVTPVQTPPTKQTLCHLCLGSALQKFRLFWVHSMLALSLLWVCFESTNADRVSTVEIWFTHSIMRSIWLYSDLQLWVPLLVTFKVVEMILFWSVVIGGMYQYISYNLWSTSIELTCNSTRFQHVFVKSKSQC